MAAKKKAKKKAAEPTKKRAKRASGTHAHGGAHARGGGALHEYQRGFADGVADVRHKRPLRKIPKSGGGSPFGRGYIAGLKEARAERRKRKAK